MERYDGKTRKDDFVKYGCIGGAVVLVFVLLQVGMHFLKKANANDYTVAYVSDVALNDAARQDIQEAVATVVGDKDGNGKIKVGFKEFSPPGPGNYDSSVMFAGEYVLFLISEPSYYMDEIFASKTDLAESKLWKDMRVERPFFSMYGCILNTKDRDVEEAEQIIQKLLEQK